MSKLLINESPLQVLPTLATRIGLNESIVLQQLHYWKNVNEKSNNNFRDGFHWTYNSYEKWTEDFPFWSSRTIQRTIKKLEDMKLVVSGNYNKLQIDRTKWYRIDYIVLAELENTTFGQGGTINIPDWLDHLDKVGLPLPEITPEITSETIYKYGGIGEQYPHVNIFFYNYLEQVGKPHPYIKREQMDYAEDVISNFLGEHDRDEEDLERMIMAYFDAGFSKSTNYNINHFANYDLLLNRMYEADRYYNGGDYNG